MENRPGKTYSAAAPTPRTSLCVFALLRDTFSPEYDDDGNQTLIRTSTGIWRVIYNGENRPVVWSNGTTVINMSFDRMGRRIEKTTRVEGVVSKSARFAYDGYLQVAEYAIANGQPSVVTRTFRDPSEPVATRPLAMKDADGNLKYDTVDLTKNVCELLNASGAVETSYSYTPFGAVTAAGAASPNRFQWSSEYHDTELDLVYYNYRHYNPADGRWTSRDPIGERTSLNLSVILANNILSHADYIGLSCGWAIGRCSRSLVLPQCPEFISVQSHGILIVIHLPDWLRQKVNALFILHHDDVKAVAYHGGCYISPEASEVESEKTAGYFAKDFKQAIVQFVLSELALPGLQSDGWVPGRVGKSKDAQPGPCSMRCVSKEKYDSVLRKMAFQPSAGYHLTKFNCQSWADFVLGE